MPDDSFWNAIDQLVNTSTAVIDRPKDSAHPRYPDMIYPLNYGYLDGTTASDGAGIDIWVGSGGTGQATGVVCTIDAAKRDAEIKILLGCSPVEMRTVVEFLQANSIGCVLIQRINVSR
jgi:inorganic pyrophosphatase